MRYLIKTLGVAFLGIQTIGCAPEAATPPATSDGLEIEERGIEVETADPALPPPAANTPPAENRGTDVQVDIGGGKGVNVSVDRDNPPADPN